MSLVSQVTLALRLTQQRALALATGTTAVAKDYLTQLTDGTGIGKADTIYHGTRTLAASASEDLDLAGTLTDAFGAVVTFAKVKGLVIVAAAGNTNNVIVGGAGANGFVSWVGAAAHTITVRPGTTFALIAGAGDAGYTVTPATADLLHLANSGAGTPVTYDVIIWGASA